MTAPMSPLVDLFILSKAISRSCSLKKVVDSGRFGSKKYVNTPSKTAGVPCQVIHVADVLEIGCMIEYYLYNE